MKAKKAVYGMALTAAAIALLASAAPADAARSDERIEASIRQSYVFRTYLKDDAIAITSRDGAVTLTGTVSQNYHKEFARKTAESLSGVTSVDNRLELKSKSPPENSDAWVSEKVTAALLLHRKVSGATTDVYVQEGIVTVRGQATSQAQKDLTTQYVKDVVGVKDVKNEMTVPAAPMRQGEKKIREKIDAVSEKITGAGVKIDDASITALVKMVLLYHRSTSALKTSVETSKGAVTLSGTAKNEAEKELAAKFAQDVLGVRSVKNQMTIESSP